MKILFTSDWQAEFSNLDRCVQSRNHILELHAKHKLDVVCFCGDQKDSYNPVDVRVIRFWTSTVQMLKKAGLEVVIDLGNHDRINQNSNDHNLLPILESAGAYIFEKPGVWPSPEVFLYAIPYLKTKEEFEAALRDANESASQNKDSRKKILIFHSEVAGSWFNPKQKITHGVAKTIFDELRFDLAIGGHIHLQQEIAENVYYVGSPFCMDWSEVNQEKAFLLYDTIKAKVYKIKSLVPGWYDLDYVQKYELTQAQLSGARIRSRITVPDKSSINLAHAEEDARLRDLYPESKIQVITTVEAAGFVSKIDTDSSEAERILAYIQNTPKLAEYSRSDELVEFIESRLTATGGSASKRLGGKLEFQSFHGENVLSYGRIDIDYQKQGLVILSGNNLDRPGLSNGSGKTNLLSMPTIALKGVTIKGQKADGWKSDDATSAVAVLSLSNTDGKQFVIDRRRPHTLKFFINGEDKSTGLVGTRKDETQGLIEKELNLDLNLLLNSIYIDTSITDTFVHGTPKERSAILFRLQNLEKYETAKKFIDEERKIYESDLQLAQVALKGKEQELAGANEVLATMLETQTNPQLIQNAITDNVNSLNAITNSLSSLSQTETQINTNIESLSQKFKKKIEEIEIEIISRKEKLKEIEEKKKLALNKHRALALELQAIGSTLASETKSLDQTLLIGKNALQRDFNQATRTLDASIQDLEHSKGSEFCPTCGQSIPDHTEHAARIDTQIQALKATYPSQTKLDKDIEALTTVRDRALEVLQQDTIDAGSIIEDKLSKLKSIDTKIDLALSSQTELIQASITASHQLQLQQRDETASLKIELNNLGHEKATLLQTSEQITQDNLRLRRDLELSRKHQTNIEAKKDQIKSLQQYKSSHELDVIRHQSQVDLSLTASEACSRKGIPRLVTQNMIPVLNQISTEYADLLTDSDVSLEFILDEKTDELDVEVINPTGSSKLEGQSAGERATIGLISALTLRDAQEQKTNLLILDEPGHGLDAATQKKLVTVLEILAQRNDTVIVTSHSQEFLNRVSGLGKHWTVTKQNKVSTLSTEE